ncbi:MAG: hypothetical protein HY774_08125 [Acidobacteria bacterium]|nr:hypothetical protein [Acidobacteriota bacterium]
MLRSLQIEFFRRGLDLAYWILPHPELAWEVASQAWETYDTLNQTQIYRSDKANFLQSLLNRRPRHYKMNLQPGQLYQLSILVKAESVEQEREKTDRDLTPADVTVHYLKTVILLTLLHNPFHVAIGIGEFVFDFGSSINLLKLYDLVHPSDCKTKQEDHCRLKKQKLFKALHQRFESLVTVCSGERGKLFFTRVKSTPPFVELVRQSLRYFAPWDARCQYCHGSLKLEFLDDPGYCHILINPDCFMKLTHLNHFGSPWDRLSIPDFKLASNHDQSPPSSPPHREPPPSWDEARLNQILNDLEHKKDRRKQLHPVAASVVVDGVVVRTLNLNEFSTVRFAVPEFSRLLEIRDTETNLLLVSQFFARWSLSPKPSVILLGTGTRLELMTTLVEDAETEEGRFEIEVRHLPGWKWEWSHWLDQFRYPGWNPLVLTTSLGALCVLLTLGWIWLAQVKRPEPVAHHIPSQPTSPLPPEPPVTPPPSKNTTSEKDPSRNSPKPVTSPRNTREKHPSPEDFTTRSSGLEDQDIDLSTFQSVYLSVAGTSFDQTIQSRLMKYLNQSPYVLLVPESNKADTRYEVTIRSSKNNLVISARLVNVQGKILWRGEQSLTQPVSEEMVLAASQNLAGTFVTQVERMKNLR